MEMKIMSKFYKLSHRNLNLGVLVNWATTKKEAYKMRSDIRNRYRKCPEDYESPVEISEVDIPKDKAGLCRWLNNQNMKDNG